MPSRVAIGGFNDLAGGSDCVPRLTTVRTPRVEMGRVAANLLLAMIDREPIARRAVDLGFELLVRKSAWARYGEV
ncbi:substrate-binding domain-containing protein [Paraburkholderia sacchari]|uniref:substrate-binding domain-containing protein n=1 Tax=Paraburkholderia sacchari TaxID=159450 RepID=UPI000541F70A|nr:substrate-binding domain-containing protein [Paraburkholderia sacchari]